LLDVVSIVKEMQFFLRATGEKCDQWTWVCVKRFYEASALCS